MDSFKVKITKKMNYLEHEENIIEDLEILYVLENNCKVLDSDKKDKEIVILYVDIDKVEDY